MGPEARGEGLQEGAREANMGHHIQRYLKVYSAGPAV